VWQGRAPTWPSTESLAPNTARFFVSLRGINKDGRLSGGGREEDEDEDEGELR
jgi:hypothetical protein